MFVVGSSRSTPIENDSHHIIETSGHLSLYHYDEETLALITREEHGGDDSDHETQYMAPEDADRYECLVAQRVLSV